MSCKAKKTTSNTPVSVSESDKVSIAAQKELPTMLARIPVGSETLYGFNNREEINAATAGQPFEYFGFNDTGFIQSFGFQVPVVVDNQYRSLATMIYTGNEYHLLDFGATVLAKEIQSTQKNYANMKFIGLLRAYKISSDFAIMQENKENVYLPLTSAKMYLTSSGTPIENFYTQDQLVSILKSKK